jgi:hypothetical protein
MRRTIYLPDDLNERVEEYLKLHHGETFSALVQRGLEQSVAPPDLGPLLELAGFVSVDPDKRDDRPVEDQTIDFER